MEIAKCEKKLDVVRLGLQKVVKLESHPEYQTTVSEEVKTFNEEKASHLHQSIAW